MVKNTSSGKIGKLVLRIILWGFLLVGIFIFTIVLLGYFTALKPVSYLPETHLNDLKQHQDRSNQIELKNSSYILTLEKNGVVGIKTIEGDVIMSNLTYYASYEGADEKWGLDNVLVKLTSDSTISITGGGSLGVTVRILLTVPKDKPKLDINISTLYTSNTVVNRESLVAGFDISVSEVYRKNGQIDIDNFDSEYWLQRQGVLFGNGNKSALIYHTPGVSSLQLETKRKLLFVNLEYYLDHPNINIPFQKDGGGKWLDLSRSKYIAGDERSNNFSVYFRGTDRVTPRIMQVPNGYLAGYVFTEHADSGNIKTHRAAYFGSEDISDIDSAIGGFAGHKIPVTKSVFYADTGDLGGSSIRDDNDWPQFLDFLDQLNETGIYDICLHTPDGSNSNREMLRESIQFMKNRFDTRTWIDHGMYSGRINRESFIADGLNPMSKYYAADLWEQYDTRYFWNPAVEMIGRYSLKTKIKELKLHDVSVNLWKRYLSPEELKKIRFFNALRMMVRRYLDNGELNSQKSYKGSAFPTPLYWKNLTQTRNFYSWETDYEKETKNLSDNKVNIEKRLLNKLKSDWGIFIDHGYYVRNRWDDGNLTELNGKLVINPYFDKILGIMAQMRDDGNLYLTTIRDLLDYWILTEKVSFDYRDDGIINIINENDKPIKGLSLVVHSNRVRINGEIPKSRQIGENTIFWFDIPAKRSMKMQFEL